MKITLNYIARITKKNLIATNKTLKWLIGRMIVYKIGTNFVFFWMCARP